MEITEKFQSTFGYSLYSLLNLNFESRSNDLYALVKRYREKVEVELNQITANKCFLVNNYYNSYIKLLFSFTFGLCKLNKGTKKDKNYVLRKLESVSAACQLNNFLDWKKKNKVLQIFSQLYFNIADFSSNQLNFPNVVLKDKDHFTTCSFPFSH